MVKKGDLAIDVKLGKVTVKAMKSIELKVGASSIFMDPKSITIKSPTITVKADGKADVTSPFTTVNADAILTLTGKLVKIN